MRIDISRRTSRALRGAFTDSSDLAPIILRMIGLNTLSAFTQDVARTLGATQVRGPTPVQGNARGATAPAQRPLEAVPAQPAQPLPRGSLLDLRV